jgi:ABC-2 type transport system ATP-binding protein
MNAVETDGLTKEYGDLTALDGLTLEVEKGELFGLLGPNGAGKSSTIEILTGQTEPTSGTARVMGVDPVENPVEARGRMGVLPEREDPPSFLTPREYFDFVGDVRGAELDGHIEEWSERLGFEDKLDSISMDLSRGQKQKVMFAQAFVHGPELVFIDEPLTNLDPVVQERVKDFIVEYNEAGNTVFLSTHDIKVAEEICTRVGIIQNGRLVAERDVEEVKDEGSSLIDEFLDEVEA